MNERAHGNKRHRIFDGTKTRRESEKAKSWGISEIDDGIYNLK
jgi:hypothetical protein